jgi:hypothetical protein
MKRSINKIHIFKCAHVIKYVNVVQNVITKFHTLTEQAENQELSPTVSGHQYTRALCVASS